MVHCSSSASKEWQWELLQDKQGASAPVAGLQSKPEQLLGGLDRPEHTATPVRM